jgi:transcriptional regulator with XRE-family HTH domain
MQVADITALREIRTGLGISREDIVRRSDVTVGTVRNAEIGSRVTRRKALQILNAINFYRREAQQAEISLDDLQLNVA